jgi:AraC family transcriptional regulator
VSEASFPRGLTVAEHTHGTGYLCFTLAGSVLDTIALRRLLAAPGYSCYVPPDTPHANIFGSAGARCLFLEMATPALTLVEQAGCKASTPWNRFGGAHSWRALVFYRALRHGEVSSLDYEELVLRSFENRPKEATTHTRPPSWLARVREHLDGELKRPLSLAVLARDADVHPMHLVRMFRKHSGCSPGEYVQTRRIAHACRLLLETRLPLVHLALHLGYYDQSHFTRAFKSRVGLTPGAYRGERYDGPRPRSAPDVGRRT